MQVRRAVVAHVAHVHPFEDVERLQHHEALRIRRALEHVDALVVDAHRGVFVGGDGGEILPIDQAALGLHVGRELLGDGALVERGAAFRADLAQRGREILLDHAIAEAKRRVAAEPDLPGRRRHFLAAVADGAGERFGDRKAAIGELDRGGEQFGQRPGAVGLRGELGARDGRRHADREDAVAGEAALAFVEVDGRRHRRDAGAVDELHLAGLREIDQHEHVAAEPRHLGLGQPLHGPRRDGRIDGVAARLQDADAGFRGERMSRRNHPGVRQDHGPPGRGLLRGG